MDRELKKHELKYVDKAELLPRKELDAALEKLKQETDYERTYSKMSEADI